MRGNKQKQKIFFVLAITIILIVMGVGIVLQKPLRNTNRNLFDGEAAYKNVETQMAFGPRLPGSKAQTDFLSWASAQLEANGWDVALQNGYQDGHELVNLTAQKGNGKDLIFLTAHYDSRLVADRDPGYPAMTAPVPGANDGASGVAVLLELARVLDIPKGCTVRIVLFDIEDNGKLKGWDWILGSKYFVKHLDAVPQAVINVDMVGDKDLVIFPEINSTSWLREDIWKLAEDMGYSDVFVSDGGKSILDDHTPFLLLGIPAVDIIDIDYPYYHTTADELGNVSANSMEIVGRVIERWLEDY